jgi:hypothetical protein
VLRPGPRRVLSSHRRALNLLLADGAVLSLVDRTVGNGPGALVLTGPVPQPTGDTVVLAEALWTGARLWVPPAPPGFGAGRTTLAETTRMLAAAPVGLLPAALWACGATEQAPGGALADLAAPGVSALRAGRWADAVRRLAGLGPGLTPSGDDLLCGFAVLLARGGHPAAAGLGVALTHLPPTATTLFSRHLLRWAARGVAPERHLAWADSLLAGAPKPPDAVLACGATSGADWAAGAVLALDYLMKEKEDADATVRPVDPHGNRNARLAQL